MLGDGPETRRKWGMKRNTGTRVSLSSLAIESWREWAGRSQCVAFHRAESPRHQWWLLLVGRRVGDGVLRIGGWLSGSARGPVSVACTAHPMQIINTSFSIISCRLQYCRYSRTRDKLIDVGGSAPGVGTSWDSQQLVLFK
jgi:hypothetical protein